MKVRLFVYALFLGFLVYIFTKNKGGFHILLFLHVLIALAVMAAAYLHVSISGFNIRIDEKGIYKEWGAFGHAFYRSKIAGLGRVSVSLNSEMLVLGEITNRGTLTGYSFGIPRGLHYMKRYPNYISLCDFAGFVKGLFSKAGHIEIDEDSRTAAMELKIDLGGNVKIIV